MQKLVVYTFMAGCVLLTISCVAESGKVCFESNSKGDPNQWTHLEFKNNPREFQFMVFADRTGGHRPGVFPQAIEKANALQPEFVMCVGDLIEGYTEDIKEIDRQWDEMDNLLGELEMPFFRVPGNHDITKEVMEGRWRERYGSPFYHFVYGDVLFLCLDTEDPPQADASNSVVPGHLSEAQLEHVKAALENNPDVRWTFIFMHQPLWVSLELGEKNNWDRVEQLLTNRPYTVFAGHWHKYVKYERLGRDYYVLATTGGQNLGPNTGTFDHVVWVTMSQDGPKVVPLALSGILEDNVVTPEAFDLMNNVFSGLKVEVSTDLTPDERARSAHSRVSFQNNSRTDVRIDAYLVVEETLSATPGSFSLTVPSWAKRDVDVVLSADKMKAVSEVGEARVKYTVTFMFPSDKSELRYDRDLILGISQVED